MLLSRLFRSVATDGRDEQVRRPASQYLRGGVSQEGLGLAAPPDEHAVRGDQGEGSRGRTEGPAFVHPGGRRER
ncbi:hypothetical protein [Streptomyces sp. NPDC002185]|uniref:hypothetical protein n=1 Tax=unclassified Streptomyces TaxID=2593676 RepID=UPI0036900C38